MNTRKKIYIFGVTKQINMIHRCIKFKNTHYESNNLRNTGFTCQKQVQSFHSSLGEFVRRAARRGVVKLTLDEHKLKTHSDVINYYF